MNIHLKKWQSNTPKADFSFYLISKKTDLSTLPFTEANQQFLAQQRAADVSDIYFIEDGKNKSVHIFEETKNTNERHEQLRLVGGKLSARFNEQKAKTAAIFNHIDIKNADLFLAEGLALANYQFLKYRKEAKKMAHSLETVFLHDATTTSADIEELTNILEAVCIARTLVNEPLSYLTAEQMANEFVKMGETAGYSSEIFGKSKIEGLRMGGLLSVNKGSIDPPTFSILEWKPENAVNKQPIVLVGKGIVYDTGGLSLKPTHNSMDMMKCDMGGAAAVSGALYAVAKNKLPLHVIVLVPATDNRPGLNAYAPGDVIHTYDGTSVEVMNTDAEGRLVLADALSYAKAYKPELVIDAATLTGSSLGTLGGEAAALMGNADETIKNQLKASSFATYERVVELPLWKEYADELKSDIADIKNLGGSFAGAITAGKFLEHFVDFPWMHLDVAGMAWSFKKASYITKGGTGGGVRLLYHFLKQRASEK